MSLWLLSRDLRRWLRRCRFFVAGRRKAHPGSRHEIQGVRKLAAPSLSVGATVDLSGSLSDSFPDLWMLFPPFPDVLPPPNASVRKDEEPHHKEADGYCVQRVHFAKMTAHVTIKKYRTTP